MHGRLLIDLDALAENYRTYRNRHPTAAVGGVVKADAYGLGLAPVARRLWGEGCRDFFVAAWEEGLVLRELLPEARIFVFEGVNADSAARVAGARLIPVLNHEGQLRAWQPHRRLPVAVHVDTGMCRLGFDPDVAAGQFAGFELSLLLTHLACADTPSHPQNARQRATFAAVARRFPGVPTSIGNSAGLLMDPSFAGDLGRPGIGLYGGNPFEDAANPMRVVATFTAPVLQVRRVGAGTAVGYGATFVAPRDVDVATVAAGYADGVPRLLSNRGEVGANGRRWPIVGRISMDLTLVDVTGSGLADGDPVEFFGPTVAVDEVAGWAQTIAYEVLTGVGGRVAREYAGG